MKTRLRLLLVSSGSALLLLTCICTNSLAVQNPVAVSKEHELGLSLYRQGKLAEATKQLDTATRKDANDWEAWYYLGLARTSNHDLKKASKALEKAATLRPEMAATHAAWSYTLFLAGNNNEAEREADRAIHLDNKRADAHCVLRAAALEMYLKLASPEKELKSGGINSKLYERIRRTDRTSRRCSLGAKC
jgi:tetratricopeptide (TPR) repeat protein